MKRCLYSILLLLLSVVLMSFRTADERAARALARRVMGDKDKKLQKYFSQFWWYMPDAQWKSDTSDFTPREWKLINEGE